MLLLQGIRASESNAADRFGDSLALFSVLGESFVNQCILVLS